MNVSQKSFAAGEISPSLYARTDQVKFATGLRTCRNYMVMRYGGLLSRGGSEFGGEVKDSTKAVRLIPFVFNADQTYVLEFGDLYMRVYRDGAQVVETAKVISAATNAAACEITTTGAHGYSTGEEVYISGIVGAIGTYLNGRNFKVVSTAATKFTLKYMDGTDVDSTAFGAYTSGGSSERIYTITTPYLEAHLPDLRFVQSADVVTIVHPSYAPRELARTAHTSWTLTVVDYTPVVARPTNGTAVGTPGGNTYKYRVTAVTEEGEESLVGYAATVGIIAATQANPCEIQTAAAHLYEPGDEIRILAVGGMTELNGLTFVVAAVTAVDKFTLQGINSTGYGAYTAGGTTEATRIKTVNKAAPAPTTPITVAWTVVSGAASYNIYQNVNGVYGYLGNAISGAAGASFSDIGVDPDTLDAPPNARNPFDGVDKYPAAISYYQQRTIAGGSNDSPETAYGSRTSRFKNFTNSSPIQDDDAITFTLAGREVNAIKHLLDLGRLIIFTGGGEHIINGDTDGVLTPTAINQRQYSYNGSGRLRPLVVGNNAVYAQARGSVIRDLQFDDVNGYSNSDLTIFSAHLFDKYTLADWAFQQIPHSTVWCVRSDGVLLGMTYVKEQQLIAWHRHDVQDGYYENVCCVPEGNEDALYAVVRRVVDGRTVRYVERMASRQISDIADLIPCDSSLIYDGRNTNGAHTMTLTSAGGWTYTDTLTLTSSAAYFAASDVGNEIWLNGSDGTVIRCEVTAFTSNLAVSVKPHKTVPAAMRTTAISDWEKAVDSLTGLWHLEGEDVAVYANGFVVASPNNAAYQIKTVADGQLSFSKCYSVICVGKPFTSDMETLDIDTPQGESLADKKKLIGKLTIFVENTRGLFAGGSVPAGSDMLEGLIEVKARNAEDYDDPVDLATGTMEVTIRPEWNSNGRVFIRQVDPVPSSILGVVPAGAIPLRG